MVINFTKSHAQSRVPIGFRAPSRNFKILTIPNVLAHGNLFEHSFVKKHDGHKLCTKSRTESSFNRFLMHYLGISKYRPFPTY
ncbi:hypothetical protein BHM03_00021809 [Ensete ventricosum]|nr:hypothetical protein BHM03_00021809 [Ensete ventricosum]